MKNTCKVLMTALMVCASAGSGAVHASTIIADWNFAEANQSTLNNTANSGTGVNGAGSSWGTAITGVKTDGAGMLIIQNDGLGGSGTRSAYADFGPAFDQITTGILSLYTTFASWNPVGNGNMQSFTMGFVEGNDFNTAEFSFFASQGGFTLNGNVDAAGDGAALSNQANLASFAPMTVRLDVDLDLMRYLLAYDQGQGFVSLGGASIDSLTQGINSLRFGLDGDFSNNPLAIERIWVEQGDATAVPEPGSLMLMLAGVMIFILRARRNQILGR